MSITKKSGKWLVRVDRKDYPRVSRSFETRGQAEEFERDFYARHRPGQSTHVLRHSFASHFIMNGGNILSLQKILGHSDIKMTMRYAHLAPDHLADAIKFNPIA